MILNIIPNLILHLSIMTITITTFIVLSFANRLSTPNFMVQILVNITLKEVLSAIRIKRHIPQLHSCHFLPIFLYHKAILLHTFHQLYMVSAQFLGDARVQLVLAPRVLDSYLLKFFKRGQRAVLFLLVHPGNPFVLVLVVRESIS